MYKTITITKEVEKTTKVCDVCGDEIHMGLTCSAIKCGQCKKDLCEKCIGHEDETGGDYRHGYCKKCWEIGQKYLAEIERLSDAIANTHDCWSHAREKEAKYDS